ncbi:MAG: Gfo/Idh/MocA family oxidoreductase [Albidovulum sp.]|nr:Gfo/Idh/MocA family oxidoreductase [Albidovulum sp.]MDE0533943.1 Gfo/Idh/MocA family oxidoreductase [Albidovulum sp.]
MARIGVIGCGMWGRNLIRNFFELGALAAVSDSAQDVANECSAAFSVPALSLSRLLMSEEIDSVAIAVPPEAHAEIAISALGRGKHVFVEKPAATEISDATKMVAAARERGATLMVGHLLRYHPAFRELMKIFSEGGIGKIEYVHTIRANHRTDFRGENAIWGFAPHDVSMILALLGQLPCSVFARRQVSGDGSGPDAVVSLLEFPSGASGHMFASWLHPLREQRLIVSGDEGTLQFDDCAPWQSKLSIARFGDRETEGIASSALAGIQVSEEEPLKLECMHFLECVDSGHHPITNGQEALAVLRVLDAINESVTTGSRVRIDQSRRSEDGSAPPDDELRLADPGD